MKLFEESPKDRGTRGLAAKIALAGGGLSPSEFVAPWAPACLTPITVSGQIRSGGLDRALSTTMKVPCRKCERCLQIRQMEWRDRAMREIAKSKRTWFLTLTFNEIHLAGTKVKSALETGSRAERLEKACYREVQKYLKRLRSKWKSSKIRYLAVFELGSLTGRPHYHLLIHEVGEKPLTSRAQDEAWPSFTRTRLVDKAADGAATYVTKYATKSCIFQIRASGAYGK